MKHRIGAIVLAAGFSSRFGSVKLCARLRSGQTVLQQTLTNLRSTIPEVLVVTRPELLSLIPIDDAPVAVFPAAEQGMGATLAYGIQTACQTFQWDGCLVCLGDMPFIRPDTYLALAAALSPDRIVLPHYGGRPGNPAGFGSQFFEALTALRGDRGGRDLVRNNPEAVMKLAVDDPAVLEDVDTPEELARLESRHADGD